MNEHEPPVLRSFDVSLPMALLRAREATMQLFRPMLASYDLTEQQWRVLRALMHAGEPIDASALAERTFLLAPSLSRILTRLSDHGLIDRAVDPCDQRRSMISLSEAGAEQVRIIAPDSEARYAAIEEAFGADRLARLLVELRTLAETTPADDRMFAL